MHKMQIQGPQAGGTHPQLSLPNAGGQQALAGPCTYLGQAFPLLRRDLSLCSAVGFVPEKQNRDSVFRSFLGN